VSVTDGANNQRYVLPDGLGSVRTLSNGADGSAYATYSYDAFGSPRTQEGPHTTFRLTGEQYDYKAREQAGDLGLGKNHGLYYLRARFYDPTIGRFLTPDPLRGFSTDPQSLNRYAYAGNNPVNRVDPTGMLTESSLSPDLSDLLDVTNCPGAIRNEILADALFAYAIFSLSNPSTQASLWVAALALPGPAAWATLFVATSAIIWYAFQIHEHCQLDQ
jgi:RHS repeat-associated protein